MDETVKVPTAKFNTLIEKAERVPQLERRELVAKMMGKSAQPVFHVKRSGAPAGERKRKAKRQAQKAARRHNRKRR